MQCFSYIVARDYGFAPNPFLGTCTLATCKPRIRETAKIGDWVIGTGSKAFGFKNMLIFAMRVSTKTDFNEYWHDQRFQCKKPFSNGSLKQMYGDNIYTYNAESHEWLQENSHHSNDDGSINQRNMKRDLGSKFVLISEEFYYFGKKAISIPAKFRNKNSVNICLESQGYKCKFPEDFVGEFIDWIQGNNELGYLGDPIQFKKFERYKGPS